MTAQFGLETTAQFKLEYGAQLRWNMQLCPFIVIVVKDVQPLNRGEIVWVTAVRMSLELIDVYIVQNRAYNYYNFILYFE